MAEAMYCSLERNSLFTALSCLLSTPCFFLLLILDWCLFILSHESSRSAPHCNSTSEYTTDPIILKGRSASANCKLPTHHYRQPSNETIVQSLVPYVKVWFGTHVPKFNFHAEIAFPYQILKGPRHVTLITNHKMTCGTYELNLCRMYCHIW